MSPRVLAVALVSGLVGLAIGRFADLPLPVAAAVLVGGSVVAGLVAERVEDARSRALAERIDGWLGREDRVPEHPDGSPGRRRLEVAVDALGAAYEDRGVELERERPWRRELVDSLVPAAMLFSQEGRLSAANAGARELLGIPDDAGEVTVLNAVGSAAMADAVREAREGGRPVTVDVERGDQDLQAIASVVGEETLLMVTDRTRERRVEELRRNFVVNASHELKTPVTSIQTLAEALEVTSRRDPERTRPLIANLNTEAERLARLVRDLLDLRRLEDRDPMEWTSVDLAELVRMTVAESIPRAERRGVEMTVDAPDHAFLAGVTGDVEVIVKNLISNAVQYNREGGGVEVTVAPREGRQVLTIADTGIGIPQQDLSRVFERFYRVDAARSRETGGTGLGLSIVRHAVQRHGGSIRVESLLGEGTTFTVTLPVEPVA